MAKEKKKKNVGGRPPKYKTAKELQVKIDKYFKLCNDEKRPYTIMGLALSLDICRDTLCEYAKDVRFSDTIKRSKAIVEQQVEERLFSNCPTGAIFWLKNNAETPYRDKQEFEHAGKGGEPLIPSGIFTDMERATRLAYLLGQASKRKGKNAKRSSAD